MRINAETLGVIIAAMIAATIAFAHADSAQATDSNANRKPKTGPSWTAYPPCTTWAAKAPDGTTHKNCIKKPNCLCPAGYN
jgi:hypothetical protein